MTQTPKTAIVTGAGHGIGRAIADRMVREGWSVVVADIDLARATDAAASMSGPGKAPVAARHDMKDVSHAGNLIAAAVDRFGKLDILVNNAGIMDRMPFLEMTEEFWHHVINTNLTGGAFCSQAAARQMVRQGHGGRIVNVASNSGIFGGRGRAAYGASKAGVINLTQSMAIELAEHDILVNAVAPGPTKTSDDPSAELGQTVKSRMPMARWGRPEEIAEVALFLASDACSFTTGHVYCADGGFTIAGMMEG